MKLTAPLLLLAVLGPLIPIESELKRPVGPCEPYAEKCRHCSDCSTCKHCAGLGGKCSVCWKK